MVVSLVSPPRSPMNNAFLDYYRCPEVYGNFSVASELDNGVPGFFRFDGLVCYGHSGVPTSLSGKGQLADCMSQVYFSGDTCILPFDLAEAVTNLRHEGYVSRQERKSWLKSAIRSAYYLLRPCLPVSVRRHLQKVWLSGWDNREFPGWPVDSTVDHIFAKLMALCLKAHNVEQIPFVWFWPDEKSSCAIMTHDVETLSGLNACDWLMDTDDSFGIKSSFQIIPEARYSVSRSTIDSFRDRGFETNVHDLRHDGHLFSSHEEFYGKAQRINKYIRDFNSKGFRSGMLYRNIEWYEAFEFSYDMSVPNVGHLDPQEGGCCTVMPFFIGDILELPVTTVQDYSLFNILGTYSTDLWERQISLIMQQHGMMSFNVHPDYLKSSETRDSYRALLAHLTRLRSDAAVWIPLPDELNQWWRARARMRIERDGESWRIEGPCKERARLAYATLRDNEIMYCFGPSTGRPE
jgi:hypothetical protein